MLFCYLVIVNQSAYIITLKYENCRCFSSSYLFLLYFWATINQLGSTSKIPIHERWRAHLASLWHSNIKLDYSMCELVNLSVTIDTHLQRYKKKYWVKMLSQSVNKTSPKRRFLFQNNIPRLSNLVSPETQNLLDSRFRDKHSRADILHILATASYFFFFFFASLLFSIKKSIFIILQSYWLER